MSATQADAKPGFSYDPFSLEARSNPLSLYPTLLADHPAYFMPDYDAYAVSRFDDVWNAFMDATNFSEAEGMLFTRDKLLEHHRGAPPQPKLDPVDMFLFLDPPHHTRYRRTMGPPFTKGSIAKMEGALTDMVRGRLAELVPQGRFDLNLDLGSYVSVSATGMIMGLPIDDQTRMVDLVNRMVKRDPERPGPTEDGALARAELHQFLKHVVARRRSGEGNESRLIDSLLQVEITDRPLTDDEIAGDLSGILVGGTETVPKVISAGMYELWKRPEQLAAVRADIATNASLAVEEMLRFNAPAQWFGRTALNPVEVAGVTLEPGQRVILLIAAANRDPREFDDPNEFIWNRKARRMISFGIGPHFCIGIHLARLELQILVRELLAVAGDYEIDVDGGEWAISEFQIGWTRLPIILGKTD